MTFPAAHNKTKKRHLLTMHYCTTSRPKYSFTAVHEHAIVCSFVIFLFVGSSVFVCFYVLGFMYF